MRHRMVSRHHRLPPSQEDARACPSRVQQDTIADSRSVALDGQRRSPYQLVSGMTSDASGLVSVRRRPEVEGHQFDSKVLRRSAGQSILKDTFPPFPLWAPAAMLTPAVAGGRSPLRLPYCEYEPGRTGCPCGAAPAAASRVAA